jgi:type II secretory pathway component GspD/PulD (secretin)
MLDHMGGSVKLGGGHQENRLGSGLSEYSTVSGGAEFGNTSYKINGRNGKISQFTATLDFSEMQIALSALESTQDARTFSNPKIIVSSGRRAVVDMTTKYPNVTIAAKKTINNNNESVDLDMKMAEIPGEDKMLFAKESFFSWGIELEVVPRVSTNGLINVQIVPTISSLDTNQGDRGFVTASSDSTASYSAKYPIIDMQRLVTEFNMESGTTAVIGGLSRTVETQRDNGIPYLRSIPWLGPWLFGSKVRMKEQKEIIVFVTVGLVNPRRMSRDAGLPKNAVLGRQYTSGTRLEPGDRPAKAVENLQSLDLRPLEDQSRDPLATNAVKAASFPVPIF